MFTLPSAFYEEENTSSVIKTADPSGGCLLDPLDLLTATPWAIVNSNTNSADARKKKTLIFANPAYKTYRPEQKEEILNALRKLKLEGFNILILGDNTLEPWNGEVLPDNYEVNLDQVNIENIRQLAWKEQGLAANKICLLDYFLNNELLDFFPSASSAKFRKNTLIISDFMDKKNTLDFFKQFLAFLNKDPQKKEKLKNIYVSEKYFDAACQALKAQQMDWANVFLKVEEKADIKKVLDVNLNLKHLEIRSHIIELNDLPLNALSNLEGIDIECYTRPPNNLGIQKLFTLVPNLKRIKFAYTENPGIFDLLIDNCLFALEEIKDIGTSDHKLSASEIKKFFKAAPNLKKMDLKNSDASISILSELSDRYFEKLEELKFESLNTDDQKFFIKWFNIAPNLKRAFIQNLAPNTQALKINQTLPLQELNLIFCTVNINDFQELLRVTPNLDKIDLLVSKFVSNAGDNVTGSALRQLFELKPNIKQLRLNMSTGRGFGFNCDNLSAVFENLKPNSLQNLETLSLLHTPVNESALNQFFKAAPNLKSISLHDFTDVDDPLEFNFDKLKTDSFKNLEKIDFSRSRFYKNFLKSLIKDAPNLKVINLSRATAISEVFENLKASELKNLEEIDLSNASLTIEGLRKLFAAAPNLKIIKLENAKFGYKHNEEQLNVSDFKLLSKLEFLDISVNDIGGGLPISDDGILELKNEYPCLKVKNNKPVQLYPEVKGFSGSSGVCSLPPLQNQRKQERYLKYDRNYFSPKNNPNDKLSYHKYFPNREPHAYRLFIWQPDLNTTTEKFTIPTDFKSVNAKNNPLKGSIAVSTQDNIEDGIYTTTESEGTNIILPSLDGNEEVVELKIIDAQGNVVDNNQLDLQRSAQYGFHQLVLPKAGRYTIQFKLKLPAGKPPLPVPLFNMISNYNTFSPNTIEVPTFESFKQAAKFYRDNRTGACRLRALAAYDEISESKDLSQYFPDSFITNNHVHSFLNVKVDGVFHTLDLGGYPAKLEERRISMNKEKKIPPKPKAEKEEKNKQNELAKKSLEGDMSHDAVGETKSSTKLKAILEPKTRLYLIQNDSSLKALYSEQVTKYGAENLFVTEESAKLNLSGYGINTEGKVIKNFTDLKRWLDKLSLDKYPHKKAAIVVDIRTFKDNEIAQLNDLLDRNIEGKILSEAIDIVLIDTPLRGYYGPDFRRRVPLRNNFNVEAEPLLLEHSQKPEQNVNVKEIDLFQSPFFEQMLLGGWQLAYENPNDLYSALKLVWKKGKLFEAIEESKDKQTEIVFKNPPLNNPDFKNFLIKLQTLRLLNWADQHLAIPNNFSFYQTNGYDWSLLTQNVPIESLQTCDINADQCSLLYLSNTNILSFIQDPAYFFSIKSDKLECQDSYLTQYQKNKQPMRVVCAPGLSESVLAQFLSAAKKQGVQLNFVTPNVQAIPTSSVLQQLPKFQKSQSAINSTLASPNNVQWELHKDIYFRTSELLQAESKITTFDFSSLMAADLGHYPAFSQKDIDMFLKTNVLSFKAPYSDIIEKLKGGETIVLTGKIPPTLYEALTKLSLGYVDGEKFKGKLIVVAPPEDQELVQVFSGQKLIAKDATIEEKKTHLKKSYGQDVTIDINGNKGLAELEKDLLKAHMVPLQSLTKTLSDSDEIRAQEIDERRLSSVKKALEISPWVMIEGKTGIGKSYFLQEILPKKAVVCNSLEDWFKSENPKEDIILVVDEANFNSQLNNMGENFLERFKGLKNNPPGFLWQGKYHPLSPHHKVVFAFNPKSYGQGRKTSGLLEEHNVPVSFEALPDFYMRARVIGNMLERVLKDKSLDQHLLIAPIIEKYRWLVNHAAEEVLITPREIKTMVNLIATKINRDEVKDTEVLTKISEEISYEIARQTVLGNPILLEEFDKVFPKPKKVLSKKPAKDTEFESYQLETYTFIQEMLDVKDTLLTSEYPDLGLGCIILEGPSKIGKTYFINQISNQYENNHPNKKVYRISPSTPYMEKVKILREAFKEGALVIAEEFNTSLWPNKMLNNYLMGLNEEGKSAKNPGFMFIGTQNPPSFVGRAEEDPAIRRRAIKFSLDWPTISADKEKKLHVERKEPELVSSPAMRFSGSLVPKEFKGVESEHTSLNKTAEELAKENQHDQTARLINQFNSQRKVP